MKKDYFNSIEDLPIWNWWKISETGNLVYLRKDLNEKKIDISLIDLWTKIHNEYLETFGMSSNQRDVLKLKKKWIEKQAAYILTGERFKLTEVDIIDAELKEIITTDSTMTNEDSLIFLEEKLGRELNPKELSVKKYNNYIKYYSRKNG